MYENYSDQPLQPSLSIQVGQLGTSWRFYSRVLGLKIVSSRGTPTNSLYLTFTSDDDNEFAVEASPFVIELTTREVTRRVTRMRIEMGSLEDLVRVWMLAKLMEYQHCGPTFSEAGCTVLLRDPDQHRIELFAPCNTEAWQDESAPSLDGPSSDASWPSESPAERFVLANRFSTHHQWPS